LIVICYPLVIFLSRTYTSCFSTTQSFDLTKVSRKTAKAICEFCPNEQ